MADRDTDGNGGGIAWRSGVVVALAFAAAFRLFRLTSQSLWFDEGTTLFMSDPLPLAERLRQFYALSTGGERFQPLYNFVIAYWREAFGDGALALRSFSAVASLGAVALVTFAAKKVFDPGRALWTAVIAGSSAFAVFYAQEARPYAFLMLLSSAQVFCLAPVLSGTGSAPSAAPWRRAHVAVVALGSFGSIFFGVFAAALALAHLVTSRAPREWLRWWVPALVAAIPALAYYLGGGQALDPANAVMVTRYGYPVLESLLFVVYGVLVGLTYGPSVLELHGARRWDAFREHAVELVALAVVLGALASLLVWTLSRPQARRGQRPNPDLLLVVAAVLGLGMATVVAAVTRVTWLPRHSFYLWIPLVLVLPAVRAASWRGRRPLGPALLALFVAANLYALGKHYFSYEYSKEDYRGVARHVLATENRGIPSVMVYGYVRLLRAYGDARTQDATGLASSELAERVRELTDRAGKVHVILSHEAYWLSQRRADVPTLLSSLYDVESTADFQNMKVYRLALRGAGGPPALVVPSAASPPAEVPR